MGTFQSCLCALLAVVYSCSNLCGSELVCHQDQRDQELELIFFRINTLDQNSTLSEVAQAAILIKQDVEIYLGIELSWYELFYNMDLVAIERGLDIRMMIPLKKEILAKVEEGFTTPQFVDLDPFIHPDPYAPFGQEFIDVALTAPPEVYIGTAEIIGGAAVYGAMPNTFGGVVGGAMVGSGYQRISGCIEEDVRSR